MLAFLKSRALLIALGLLLLALLLWFAGPYFAFADFRPLESVVARLVAIIVLVVGYAIYIQLKQLKNAKAGRQLAEGVTAQAKDADGGGARGGGADAAQLRKRFEEAVEALKKSKKGRATGLYELPWYIIIGPPGAGKTTVLVNSGLNFPLAQKFGKEALRGVGGTRNCDWWFTDEAILLDTAGRYTTQDSNARADAAGWTAFLQLLRKFRGRQPINGVIVAVSATDLLALGEREREHHVAAIRERLDELSRNLRIDVPVYFLVTKCDLVAGFSEFFDDLNQESRGQVWGVTFPIESTESGRAAGTFGNEFDRLIERLQQRVLARMENERDPRRRVGILAFPQQMVTLKPFLDDLLKRVFTTSEFDRAVLLRGVYFTSGTQEGTPIDRMLGAIARTFGVTSAVAAPSAGRGKAYFIERLLKNVIFNESGLAGVNRRVQLQKIMAASGAYIACLVVLVLGTLWLFVSYSANASYIDEVAAAAKGLEAGAAGAPGASLPVDAFLPQLDTAEQLTVTAEKYKGGTPWSMRAGLYRGGALGEAAREAYSRELNATLVPALRGRFEQALQTNVATPDRLYEYLKAYLMLGEAKHRDANHLRFLSEAEWRLMYPTDAASAQRLGEHFDQLLSHEYLKSVSLNAQVIEQARSALSSARLPVLMYSRLKLSYHDDSKHAVRLDIAAGTGAYDLVRRSGKPLAEPVPAIYSRAVFNEFNSTGKYELLKQFAADGWVFGDNVLDLRQGRTLLPEVFGVYEQDYIRAWDEVVKDVGIKSASTQQEFVDILGVVSSPTSPLKGFLSAVADNTNLLKPDTSLTAKATQALDAVAAAQLAALKKIIGEAPAGAQPGALVTQHFEKIQALVAGAPGQAPIDQMLAQLKQQYDRLAATGSGVGQQSAMDPAVQRAVADAKRQMEVVATQLPGSLGSMVSEVASRTESIVSGEARNELARRYAEMVVKDCKELVEGRYPLNSESAADVPLLDFGRVFGSGGVFDSFFQANLAPLVDTSSSPWHWRAGASAGPPSMLPQFQRAQRIRDVFFGPGGKAPEAHFTLTPETLDASVTRFSLEVDGQPFEYRHGPQQSRSINWPGAAGQASFAFEDSAGPVPGATRTGPWAWFRLLDAAQVEHDSDTKLRLTFSAGGKSMRVALDAASVRNPFARNEVRGFRCTM